MSSSTRCERRAAGFMSSGQAAEAIASRRGEGSKPTEETVRWTQSAAARAERAGVIAGGMERPGTETAGATSRRWDDLMGDVS